MIQINLLPEDLRRKEPVKIVLPEIPVKKTATLVIAGFVGLQLLLGAFMLYQNLHASALKKNIEALKAGQSELIAKKTEMESMRERLKQFRSTAERKFFWYQLLNALSDSMTRGVWLRSFAISSEEPVKGKKTQTETYLKLECSVVGQGGQETASIGKFIKQMKSNPVLAELFSDIQVSNINQTRLKDADIYDFVLMCPFKKERWS